LKAGKRTLVTLALIISMFVGMNTVSASENDSHTDAAERVIESMGFSKAEISNMSPKAKETLIESGGEKAEYEVSLKKYYTSLDGTKYEITKENADQIESIKKRDITQFSKESGVSMLRLNTGDTSNNLSTLSTGDGWDEVQDGKLYVTTYVAKTISGNASEHEYIAFLDYAWDTLPWAGHTDEAAIAWDNRFTGITNTVDKYLWTYIGGTNNSALKTTPEVYGIKAEFPIAMNSIEQIGGFSQHIRVPKVYDGQTGRIIAKYVHHLKPKFSAGITIGYATINVPEVMTEVWHLEMNIRIGNSY
jgi:hypothetical protein